MHLRILAVGTKMPSWVQEGYQDYAKRFPKSSKIELIEIPPEKRSTSQPIKNLVEKEGSAILSLLKSNYYVVALDVKGKSWSTETLAANLTEWQKLNKGIDFIIGGPDGLSKECLERANIRWSLSPLTFPHPFVRIMLIEQLYRAQMIIQGHPYHRS